MHATILAELAGIEGRAHLAKVLACSFVDAFVHSRPVGVTRRLSHRVLYLETYSKFHGNRLQIRKNLAFFKLSGIYEKYLPPP